MTNPSTESNTPPSDFAQQPAVETQPAAPGAAQQDGAARRPRGRKPQPDIAQEPAVETQPAAPGAAQQDGAAPRPRGRKLRTPFRRRRSESAPAEAQGDAAAVDQDRDRAGEGPVLGVHIQARRALPGVHRAEGGGGGAQPSRDPRGDEGDPAPVAAQVDDDAGHMVLLQILE